MTRTSAAFQRMIELSSSGSWRKRARVSRATLWWMLGGYRDYWGVDWGRVARLVFVCSGNICRSPYAEYRASLLGVDSTSFGLHATSGLRVDGTALAIAARRGVNMETARTRRAEDVAFDPADLLIAMTPAYASAVRNVSREVGSQVTLLGLWGGLHIPYLPDPFGASPEVFERCYGFIDIALEDVCDRVKMSRLQAS